MLFNSFSYLLFLPVVFLVYWALAPKWRIAFLLGASYFFYMSWKPVYGLLIFALTTINYGFGLLIASASSSARAKLWLVLGLIGNLGCLCFFKYTNFLADSWNSSLTIFKTNVASQALLAGIQPVNHFDILLPLGISFFTFEFIHYIVDVYRGHQPIKRPLDFFLFASFFPSQIAGPIKRFQDFRSQLENLPVFKKAYLHDGLSLILQGAFKKIALGDNLALIANQGFDHYQGLSVTETWLAALAFAFQLFFDFSGYTDMGRGSALILGFKVPENFNIPYLAGSPTEFWNRWHLSLSTWLRDYLYIPLGGSRGGRVMVWRNLVITMGLSGLWHGAAWHFVAWGLAHAVVLVISKEWQKLLDSLSLLAKFRTTILWHTMAVAVTFVLMCAITVFFRAQTVAQACSMILHLGGWGAPLVPLEFSSSAIFTDFELSTLPFSLVAYAVYCVSCWCFRRVSECSDSTEISSKSVYGLPDVLVLRFGRWCQRSVPLKVSFCVAVAITVVAFAPGKLTPFIYFQF